MNTTILYSKIKELENKLDNMKNVVDSGEQIDSTGWHYYEKYGDGKARAWGTVIISTTIDNEVGGFHRASGRFSFGQLLDFQDNELVTTAFCDERTEAVNTIIMTASASVNNNNEFRIMSFNPSPVTQEVNIYVNYSMEGIPVS